MRSLSDLHVITGGPGAGKTSLLAVLAARGYAIVPESGRSIIRQQMMGGGDALPWQDREGFAARMQAMDEAAYLRMGKRGKRTDAAPVFFDRALPDVLGYRRLKALTVPASLCEACETYRYAPTVFVAPPWPSIYAKDSERKQDYAEAVRTHDIMREVYRELGYVLVDLPFAPIDERAEFILSRIG